MKRIFFILVFLLFLVSGCKTVYVPVESTKTEYRDHAIRDSIHIHDSIYVQEKGDTIYLTRWRVEYRDRIQMDSVFVRDSISVPYPVEVIKTVEKDLSRWQKMKIETGGIAFGILFVFFVYVLIRGISKLKLIGWKGLISRFFKR